jgi:hypothetical protein
MQNRSSIFSFDTLPGRPWPAKSFLVVPVMVLLSVLLVESFCEAFRLRDPNSHLANVIRYLRSQENAPPRIVFFGSSRTHSCIDPNLFAQESGLACGQVLNLAQPSWGAWQALVILRHTEKSLAGVKTAFVELTPDSFNDNALHPITHKPAGNPEEFDVWANYPERVQPRNPHTRTRLLAEYVLPFEQRRSLIAWLIISKQLLLRQPGKGAIEPPDYYQNAERVALLAADPDFKAATISRYHLHDYQFSNREVTLFRELLAVLRARGVEVVIFHPPVRAAYYDYVAAEPQRQEFEKFRSFARDLAREYRVIYWETLEDCGLDESAVVDYGHFSREGAARLTQRLFAAVHSAGRTASESTPGREEAARTSAAGIP